MRIVAVGNFGLTTKQTMAARALPLLQALGQRGHTVWLVLPTWDEPARTDRTWSVQGVTCLGLSAPGGPLWPYRLALRTLRVVWTLRPDLVYCFKPKAFAGAVLLAFWLGRRLGRFHGPLVLDTDDWEGDGGWNDRERARFRPWERRLIAWHERWCLVHADLVTAASQTLADRARALGARRVLYLPNGLAATAPAWTPGDGRRVRRAFGLGDRPLVLIYTRFVEFAPDRLVATLAAIIRSRPPVAALIVGRGLAGEERACARLVDRAGLADRVVFAGWVQPDDLPDYFAAADLALYLLDDTLLNRAKCPVKLLELLAAGVPVVADAVGEAQALIRPGETGILVPPGDTVAMATAALALLDDPARRWTLGAQAREFVRRHRLWEGLGPRLVAAIEALGAPGWAEDARPVARSQGGDRP